MEELKCDCGCGESFTCDMCGKPLYEGEPHYVLGMSLMKGYNGRKGRDVVGGFPIEVRCMNCGMDDIYEQLEIEDPGLELTLMEPN